jgi:microcystin-dependent protein
MPNPTSYAASYSFSGFQANNPTASLPAPALDNELSNIQTSVKSLVSSVMDVRRSDGTLNNGIVTLDSLSQPIALMFDAGTTANATLLANAVISASASAVSAAASLAAAQALPLTDPAVLFAGAVMANETGLASAATVDIGSAATVRIRIDNNVTISSLGFVPKCLRFVRFTGSLTLTHNAASLALVNGVSRIVSAGDQSVFMSDSSGNWRELDANGVEAPGMVPLGAVLEWYDDVLPTSGLWAWANGSTVSTTLVAPILLARWGARFGGDGITTMGLPDRRETVAVGKFMMGGAADRGLLSSISSALKGVVNAVFGADTVALTAAKIPTITAGGGGTIAGQVSTGVIEGNGVGTTFAGSSANPGSVTVVTPGSLVAGQPLVSGTATITSTSNNTGGTSPTHANLGPSTAVNFIVRIA